MIFWDNLHLPIFSKSLWTFRRLANSLALLASNLKSEVTTAEMKLFDENIAKKLDRRSERYFGCLACLRQTAVLNCVRVISCGVAYLFPL